MNPQTVRTRSRRNHLTSATTARSVSMNGFFVGCNTLQNRHEPHFSPAAEGQLLACAPSDHKLSNWGPGRVNVNSGTQQLALQSRERHSPDSGRACKAYMEACMATPPQDQQRCSPQEVLHLDLQTAGFSGEAAVDSNTGGAAEWLPYPQQQGLDSNQGGEFLRGQSQSPKVHDGDGYLQQNQPQAGLPHALRQDALALSGPAGL